MTNKAAPEFDLTWQPPQDVMRILTVDTHTAGEPLRVILAGLPDLGNGTVLEKRRLFMDKYDHLRTGLLLEPRGHSDMYGAIITAREDQHGMDVCFINTVHYSTMCGHAILALAHLTFETKLLGKHDPAMQQIFNTPAGPCYAGVTTDNGQITGAWFKNVDSFVYLRDQHLSLPGHENLKFDVCFGGAFYAVIDATVFNLKLTVSDTSELIRLAKLIKKQVSEMIDIKHPVERDLDGLFGVIFVGPAHNPKNHSRNVNVFEQQEIDRSPTGTGVSARCALHYTRGDLALNQSITIESIIGSEMTVEPIQETKFEQYPAIVPRVSGKAFITGRHELYFHPKDPYKGGFAAR